MALCLEEAAEQLATLSDGLLRIERDAADSQLVQAVFRAAHTLKGSSATIGHHRMAQLTDGMESVLDQIRKGSMAPTSIVIDSLLGCIDALNVLNQEVLTGVQSDLEIDQLVARLHLVNEGGHGMASTAKTAVEPAPTADAAQRPAQTPAGPPLDAADQAAVTEMAAQDGMRAIELNVTINPASEWPAVRAYQALTEIAPLGTVVRSWPAEAELQTGEGGHALRVILVTDRESAIVQQAATGVTDVIAVTAHPFLDGADAEPAPTTAANESNPAPAPQPTAETAAPEPEVVTLRPEEPTTAPVAASKQSVQSRMVKVDITRLDEMMNLVGEMVIDRGRLFQVLRELTSRVGADPAIEHLSDITQHLARVSNDLQQQVMLSRLLPVESVFNRFPRMVRDLARKTGKSVRFELEGEQTGLDRSVIDEIGDPLLHLLRNAVDHGVELPDERVAAGKPAEATLLLSARHEESYIVIEVKDDGRGIDPRKLREAAVRKGLLSPEAAARTSDEEAINLIFAPGFSSVEKVTDVSGRGVGMDIVRTNIEKINGSVRVSTQVGEGTTFSIKLPLTLAIIRALLVRVGEATFTIPLVSVQETLRIHTTTIHTVQGREVVLVRGRTLPLVRLADVFSRGSRPVQRLHPD